MCPAKTPRGQAVLYYRKGGVENGCWAQLTLIAHVSLLGDPLRHSNKCWYEIRAKTEELRCWDGVGEKSCCMVNTGA